MYKKTSIIFILIFIAFQARAAQVAGFVYDAKTGEVLIGANVWCKSAHQGTVSDNRGYFALRVNEQDTLQISYIGYTTHTTSLHNIADTLLHLSLEPNTGLNEVLVTAQRRQQFDVSTLSAKQMEQLPTLGGKPDVIKALQLMAGVQGTTEGSSLMMVRGGDPGQNQYLLDNVPLIYVNHLGGFMSVFNPDMINSIDLYKGNFPARFGGKLSSIVDVTQRTGDASGHKGSFSIGLTDASATFEGPLGKNKKTSYMVTARKTFTELLMAGVSALVPENEGVVFYGFHDINAKLSYKPNAENALYLNFYYGDDYMGSVLKKDKDAPDQKGRYHTIWGNVMLSARWNRTFSSKLLAENTVSYTRYRLSNNMYSADDVDEVRNVNRSTVQDVSWRSAWKFSAAPWWQMEAGTQASYLNFEPNYTHFSEATTQEPRKLYHSGELALYWENKIRLGSKVLFQPSVRLTDYINSGKHFLRAEPRISLQVNATPNHSFNLGLMTVSQNSHLLFTEGIILNDEIWFPAIERVPPQVSHQLSGGWIGYLHDRMFSVQLDGYYKQLTHQVALREGFDKFDEISNLEHKLETGGVGSAYGLELSVKKEKGLWTGFASYTWSESTRKFATINNGKPYQAEYNRPHSFAINVNRKINKQWNVNALWVIASGQPYTPAIGQVFTPTLDSEAGSWGGKIEPYNVEQSLVYGDKNSARMPVYHRLDVGATYDYVTTKGNRAQWSFSVYNLYSRQNPCRIFYATKDYNSWTGYLSNDKSLRLYQESFFPIVPTVSWKMFFDYKKKNER